MQELEQISPANPIMKTLIPLSAILVPNKIKCPLAKPTKEDTCLILCVPKAINKAIIIAITAYISNMASIDPAKTAIPSPPLNLAKTGLQCPTIAPINGSRIRFPSIPIKTHMLIAKIPLKKSPVNAAQPSSLPKFLVTFEDPANFEPTSTMFSPLLLLIKWQIGIDPIT